MSPKKVTKPIDIYVRVSQVGGRAGDAFISPEVQEQRCRAQLEADGNRAGQVFTDLDQSGRKMARPEFDRVMARAKTGQSGGIVVYKLSRFGRTTRGVLAAIAELEEAGAAFVSCDPKIDTSSPSGRFMLTVFTALDELEVENLTLGWRVAHANHIARGVHSGSAPAGYAKGDDKVLVPNEYAPAIREAFRMKAEEGANKAGIARYLTAQAVPTRRNGTLWTAGTVAKMLGNRAYLGEARYGDLVHANGHEALVDERTFRLASRKEARRSGNRGDGQLLGSGLCRCGTCGGGLVYGKTKQGKREYEFLRCQAPKIDTPHAAITVGLIEPYLVDAAFNRLVSMQAQMPSSDEDAHAAEVALAAAEDDLVELERMLTAGEIPATAYAKAAAKAEADRDAAQAALAAATPGELLTLSPDRVREMLFLIGEEGGQDVLGNPLRAYTAKHVPTARQFLKDALGLVTVNAGRGTVEERVVISEAA
jgi:DNA invertase Pin-like site-specific DNA recombinase